ncbi:prepilin peptidase [Pacificimonas sp. WHA3]|uniref:Prepilin peptidase n=1 Tax=Pacificimonas pallii TaxID=2827236 RepID=A0ABS6SHD0_9SPHN|nr:A24 family peptidase [Pacificimonas pallii]MBV7257804.1 prepilin peptidase [Pacificimonas pallii]
MAILGAVMGSFIGVVALRTGRDDGIVRARSRCDNCRRQLDIWELVPVVSFAVLRGRCRTCKARIAVLLPLLEIAGAAIGMASAWIADDFADLMLAGMGWTLLCLAILDMRHFWLPDRVTLPLAVAGIMFAALQGDLISSLAGGAIGWAALVLVAGIYERITRRQGLGGGDPKLLAAIGTWVGAGALPFIVTAAALAGLAAAFIMAIRGQDIGRTTRLPFGTLLAIGTYIYVPMASFSLSLPYAVGW